MLFEKICLRMYLLRILFKSVFFASIFCYCIFLSIAFTQSCFYLVPFFGWVVGDVCLEVHIYEML